MTSSAFHARSAAWGQPEARIASRRRPDLRAEIVGMGRPFACTARTSRRGGLPPRVEYACKIVGFVVGKEAPQHVEHAVDRAGGLARPRCAGRANAWNARTGTTTRQPAAAFFPRELISDKIRRQAKPGPALCQNSSGHLCRLAV